MKSISKYYPYVVAVALLVGLGIYSYWPSPIDVEVVTITQGPMEVTIREDGKTRVRERYVVSTPIDGELMRIAWRAGDRVSAGETVLATMAPSDPSLLDARAKTELEARAQAAELRELHAQSQWKRTQANLEFAKAQFARSEKLLQEKAIAMEAHEEVSLALQVAEDEEQAARFAIRIAEFEHEQAKAALIQVNGQGTAKDTPFTIRSPIDGEVLKVYRESEGRIAAGSPLLELGDRSDMELEVDFLSSDAVRIQPGSRMYIDHWGGTERLIGRVRMVEPQGFMKVSALGIEEQRVNVIAEFVDPIEKRKRLGDGYRVEAAAVVWSSPKVLKAPAGAFFRHEDGWAAFVLRGNQATMQSFKIGHTNGLETEILEGGKEGDRLVAYPSDKLREGLKVRILHP